MTYEDCNSNPDDTQRDGTICDGDAETVDLSQNPFYIKTYGELVKQFHIWTKNKRVLNGARFGQFLINSQAKKSYVNSELFYEKDPGMAFSLALEAMLKTNTEKA